MSFIDDVRAKRQKLADVLSDEDYSGIREIVEELYPDRAHFIFELLQNSEDAGASEAKFVLSADILHFMHNGQPFSEDDVWGITNIGKGKKRDQTDKIGRFGVGFKAVFAYCETPQIWSSTFSFKISELVLPTELKPKSNIGKNTYFEFPFNNPKKSARDAYTEIKMGLEEMADTSLLFLSSLKSISWQIDQQPACEFLRFNHSEYHIEIQKQVGGKIIASSHFLWFSDAIEDLGKQRVAIAFELDFLPDILTFDAKKPLDEQLKIIPAKPGKVSVFFPAEKESSGLRFHLHAPFVPELSRASIKETPVNEPLFRQLARLTASSLHTIRNLKLLTGDFLGVLPNPKDEIPERYQPIRNDIITEMNTKQLTPTYAKKHESAIHLVLAKKSLKELLSDDDLEFLLGYDEKPFKWAIGAQQKNSNVDYFLNALDMKPWDFEAFVKMLQENVPENLNSKNLEFSEISEFTHWLGNKSEEWHQDLYALLESEILTGPNYTQKPFIDRLKRLKIIRLSNNNYSTGSKCYFPSDGTENDDILPRVAIGVYSSGKSKVKQDNARNLLIKVGVREVGETEQVEAILKQRYYPSKSFKPDINDLNRFITLVEKEPQQSTLFADYHVFKRADGNWGKPAHVFLDTPFCDTGISAYYDTQGDSASRMALDSSYQDCGISLKNIAKFANAVGVLSRLKIEPVSCEFNPKAYRLIEEATGKLTHLYIDLDYTVKGLEDIIDKSNKALSLLVWRTLCGCKIQRWITAQYRRNGNQEVREAPSQLICILRDAKWVPQNDGSFVRPCEASPAQLPKGFSFNADQEWLEAVHFGESVLQRSEEQKNKQAAAKDLGFTDLKSLEEGKWYVGLDSEERQQIRDEHQSRHAAKLSDRESANPGRRHIKVIDQAEDAPERLTDLRTRSFPVGRETVKKEASEYLRQQYTNDDRQMFCQVCKKPVPFKLDNGDGYFETVEFLSKLTKQHYQNYIALCPNHAAMFKHANGTSDRLRDMFIEIDCNELDVILAQNDTTIYFTKIHIADLNSVIEAEQQDDERDVQP